MRSRLLALLAIIGPGLIVMVGDNDAGGVATYSQAGQNYGTSLLWVLLLLVPVLIVNQEMVVRLGAVTGVGHARLINERFGRFWGWFSVGDLFILNFLTIVTEFIGVSLSLGYLGVSQYVAVPIAAVALVAITVSGSFRFWERSMFVFVFANVLIIPLFLLAQPSGSQHCQQLLRPRYPGRRDLDLGTADHRDRRHDGRAVAAVLPAVERDRQAHHAALDQLRAPRHLDRRGRRRARRRGADLRLRVRPRGHPLLRAVHQRRGDRRRARGTSSARPPGAFFAIVLLNASLIGAGALTLSTSYAFGDVFGTRSSLHRSFADAKVFYGIFAALIAGAAAIVLIPGAPLGVITEAVQALAGVLLPSATVFLLLLCNEREVLGPWRNGPWLNALATLVVSVLILLSLILMATTVFPSLDVTKLMLYGALGVGVVLVLLGLGALRGRREAAHVTSEEDWGVPREQWTMPPLALLDRPTWSTSRKAAMLTLRIYLVLSIVILVIKAVQLGGG